ncbi:CheR family methyltransferase [Silvibacterium dinghuense]|uniref:protein-glutamate O-methyltransferase n=1 Tax=Silvibacterium dinghuense TaxID=1560006 RepID=A0A4Q1SD47_9BACT|nr:protein-glutamate O-methyltransferase CheR [Silvibacterium dinghuense]RXS94997.1 protein-glutamate O-methyltransferase CheR [Silvibacterium dinghuense]GGH09705.1 chemotaxis protein methyltransferase [Silvibacterium dinghuense]
MIESRQQVETKPAPAPRVAISKENYSFLQRHLYAASGIVIDASKDYLIDSRLMPIVRVERLQSLDELCQHIRGNTTSLLSRRVVEAMTTNETLFFRDVVAFDALKKHVLPRLLAGRQAGRKLTIWSAAASTGQEAYSVAMMLLELGVDPSEVQILGTDLSEQVLERARKGRYLQLEVNRGLPAAYLLKYFRQAGMEWEIQERVRRMVTFEPLDLRQRIRNHGPFDLVLCRNVLIYFDVETKRAILNNIQHVLRRTGVLVLGCAETMINLHNGFTSESMGGATFYAAK